MGLNAEAEAPLRMQDQDTQARAKGAPSAGMPMRPSPSTSPAPPPVAGGSPCTSPELQRHLMQPFQLALLKSESMQTSHALVLLWGSLRRHGTAVSDRLPHWCMLILGLRAVSFDSCTPNTLQQH